MALCVSFAVVFLIGTMYIGRNATQMQMQKYEAFTTLSNTVTNDRDDDDGEDDGDGEDDEEND